MTVALVALLGGLGAATRFVVDGLVRSRARGALPVATVVVNVTGSLLLGLLTGAHLFHGLGSLAFTAAATGFCGGYTTFSTAMVETVRLVQAGEVRWAVLNALGTLVTCVAAASAGVGAMWLTGR
ncbi:fluoride efflux transporter FluC [Cellulomonas carbonis]|uniref:Fluoride-specific ion channel FluC n=1 Tax=Cellulomonas carbonis T26 TaxID=947969 RepID=A0A0A0BR67_9CELL|nr:CrcB family protein [Cellulomonas carbonis]KGM09594.1 chromosome condensation protein CrcB [Cellulomonas carbonis T26]GGC07369.1 putative fluoride ion transporter CrcB [Cellulomonas carbonis]